jgi:CRP-like cAMP-binding protein
VQKLKLHSPLADEDIAGLRALSAYTRIVGRNEDFIRQGDKPHAAAIVLRGMTGRYHTLRGGRRQYLSFHLTGDMPDVQSLFLERMDHAVCGIGEALIALVPHDDLLQVFQRHPAVGLAFWRETLIDAAIFRQAITNNGSRPALSRIAHLFCELYCRARAAGLGKLGSCELPLSQSQLGEALGMSIVSVNRTIQSLRQTGMVEFRNGTLTVYDWNRLAALGDFESSYLHLTQSPPPSPMAIPGGPPERPSAAM